MLGEGGSGQGFRGRVTDPLPLFQEGGESLGFFRVREGIWRTSAQLRALASQEPPPSGTRRLSTPAAWKARPPLPLTRKNIAVASHWETTHHRYSINK